jgi:CheY-like chemotaxis protein
MMATMASCLIVDDDPSVCDYLCDVLCYLGHEAEAVDRAEAALEILARLDHGYDLVFLDIRLPGMGGLELLRRIRKQGRGPKVVMLTGDLEPATFGEVEDADPAVSFIHKPFNHDTLKICLDVVLSKGGRFTHKKSVA